MIADASAPLTPREQRRRAIFLVVWALTSAGLGWAVLRGYTTFDSQATLPALLALLLCTGALLFWLGSPRPRGVPLLPRTRQALRPASPPPALVTDSRICRENAPTKTCFETRR